MKTYQKIILTAGMLLVGSSAFAECQKLPLVILDQYEYAECVENGLATVTQNGKEGIVNTQGQVVVPIRYTSAVASSDGTPLASVCLYGKCGFASTQTGKLVIPMKYEHQQEGDLRHDYQFKNGLSAVAITVGENSKFGFIDTAGNTVIPFDYDNAENFSQGLAQVRKNDKWGFINKNNQAVIPLQYESVGNFNNGLAPVSKYEKWGFINPQNQLVIPYKYDYAESFSEGLAVVGKHNENGNLKIGFINPQGQEVIPLRFDGDEMGYNSFDNGKAYLELDGVYGYINKAGKFTPEPISTNEASE